MIVSERLTRAGLVATNSIRGGANRVVLKQIVEKGSILDAWSDEGWTVEGAAVRVSLVCFAGNYADIARLNGSTVKGISAALTGAHDRMTSRLQGGSPKILLSFMGVTKSGPFDLDGATARRLLRATGNPHGRPNADVVKRSVNGIEVIRRPTDGGYSTSVHLRRLLKWHCTKSRIV
jgi:hypothetical protein